MNFKEISNHYFTKIITAPCFDSKHGCNNTSLLFPDFYFLLTSAIGLYNEKFPESKIIITDTFRSNKFQSKLHSDGQSHYKSRSPHHFGLAAGIVFSDGKKIDRTGNYKHLFRCMREKGFYRVKQERYNFQHISTGKFYELRKFIFIEIRNFQLRYRLNPTGKIDKQIIITATELSKRSYYSNTRLLHP
ncbi:MAG: hypothetical protein FJ216_02325 [Ignavibacteria bacterium]|nr:hypothetical protein [Ignavibacteria bacterium]